MTPQDPTALGAPMPTMPDAPPDPFGGMIQAIAAGFAAGFGGKTVADQIAQNRQNSWEAWQRKQDATLRREELDRADRRFAMSLEMQRTQLEYEKGRDERAAAERATSAKAEQNRFDMTFKAAQDERAAKDRSDTMRQAGLADFAVKEGILPEGTLFTDPSVLEAAQRSRSETRADERFNIEFNARRDEAEAARKADADKETRQNARSDAAERRNYALRVSEMELDKSKFTAQERANIVAGAMSIAEKGEARYPGISWQQHYANGLDMLKKDMASGVQSSGIPAFDTGFNDGSAPAAAVPAAAPERQVIQPPTESRPTAESRPAPAAKAAAESRSAETAQEPISLPKEIDDDELQGEIERIVNSKSRRGALGRDDVDALSLLVKEASNRGIISPREIVAGAGSSLREAVVRAAKGIASRVEAKKVIDKEASLRKAKDRVDESTRASSLTKSRDAYFQVAEEALRLKDADKEIEFLRDEYESRTGRVATDENLTKFMVEFVGLNRTPGMSAWGAMNELRIKRKKAEASREAFKSPMRSVR